MSEEVEEKKMEICAVCSRAVLTMTFKGSGVCCEDCRKDRDNDHEPARLTFYPKGLE